MKYGRSILLSELIEAARIGYSDCRAFQIVCPVCNEPVFKVVREEDVERHYLSHYKAAAAYSAECELRVEGFNQAEIDKENLLSRGQKLSLFLRVLRDAIARHEFNNPPERVGVLYRTILRSKSIRDIRDWSVTQTDHAEFGAPYFETAAQGFVDEVGVEHEIWKEGFGLETRRRIARDLWLALRTPQWRPNMLFLWIHGYAYLLGRLQTALSAGALDESGKRLRLYAERLVRCGARSGAELLAEMQHSRTPEQLNVPGGTYFTRLVSEVQHEMVGCLLRLPYLQILTDNRTAH